MTTLNIMHLCISFISGACAYFLGGYDLAIKTMLFMTAIDFITGIGSSIYKHKFSCKKCVKGIFKKVYIYITVAFAVVVQKFLGNTIPLRETVIVFYIVNEGFSCLENIGKVISYPTKLKEIFEQLESKNE